MNRMARHAVLRKLTLSGSLLQRIQDLYRSCISIRIKDMPHDFTLQNETKYFSTVSNFTSSSSVINNFPRLPHHCLNVSRSSQRLFNNSSIKWSLTSLINQRGYFFSNAVNTAIFDVNTEGKNASTLDHGLHDQSFFYSTKGVSLGAANSKNQSALLVKRSPRKKIPKIHDAGRTRQLNNVVAYALGEEIKLEPLKRILLKQGLYAIGELPTDVNDALHVRGIYNVDQKPKEIFVFDDGSVVFWRVPEVERGAFLKLLMKFCEAPYPGAVVLTEREELDFAYIKGQTAVLEDLIQLKERAEDGNDLILELYAFSNAMSQSVKLSVWEASLENFITSIEVVTEDVRHGRKISMSRRKLLKKSGELMSLRHLINLSSDLLDTPDFYWDRASLEPLYQSLCSQLSISKRTKVINEKLTHCCELVDLVSRHMSDEHHIRLEIMIIILILVEVVFEVIHFVKDYVGSQTTAKPVADGDEDNVASPKD